MFYIDKNTPLTEELLTKFINSYTTTELPKLNKRAKQYNGQHKILNKHYADETKPCNKIVTNFCKVIVDTYAGYICGKPISYTSENDIEDIQSTLNYNDTAAEDMQFITNALNYGVAYELCWLDEQAQIRYAQIKPTQAFAIFDNSLENELLYFVRWYKENSFKDNESYITEVYTAAEKRVYQSTGIQGSRNLIEATPHFFQDIPATVFYLNSEESNIYDSIVSLNDAYNELQSSEIDDFAAWVDAYLALTGVDADADDIKSMRENRVLILPENARADFITKNANDTQITNMLESLKKNIYKISACPDMTDEAFMAQSGTALAYKLVGFENIASGIVARFKKALQRRIELICNILDIKASNATWRDIQINFVRNLPNNIEETVKLVQGLQGIVSNETLLAQLPFVVDVAAEVEKIKADKQANLAMYDFGAHSEEEEAEVQE